MEKYLIVIGMAVLLFVLVSCGKGGNEVGYKHMKMSDAVNVMAELDETETKYIILDVRTPEEFSEGHIPDAINIANETIGDKEIAALPNKEQTIFVYCRSGNRSTQSAKKLVKLGYTDIIEMGGIGDWPKDIVR